MSKGRRAFTAQVGAPSPRRRRWAAGVLGSIACSGLILGALAFPVSADDVTGGGNAGAWASVEGQCVAAGTAGGDGSVDHQGEGEPARVEVSGDGTGTAEVSVCGDDVEGLVQDLMPAVEPGDVEDAVPGNPAGLIPDVLGLGPDIMSRLARILPRLVDTDGAAGFDAGRPAITTPSSGSGPSSVVADAAQERETPLGDDLPGAEIESVVPTEAGTAPVPAGAMLPRTGGGPGVQLLRLLALAAAGRAILGLAGRRRKATA